MLEHTKEPWRYDFEPGYCGELISADGKTIATFIDEPSDEDARRIVACVNACAGIDTAFLERTHSEGYESGFRKHIECERQRDQLLSIIGARDYGEAKSILENLHTRLHAALNDAAGAGMMLEALRVKTKSATVLNVPEAVDALRKDSDYLVTSELMRAEVEQQRDELLAAAKIGEDFMSGFEGDQVQQGVTGRLAVMRAAIAKVRGGAA